MADLFDDWYDYVNPYRYAQKGTRAIKANPLGAIAGAAGGQAGSIARAASEKAGGVSFSDIGEGAKGLYEDVSGITAAEEAAEAQKEGLAGATASQERMFEKSLATQKPWLEAGERGLAGLEAGLESGRFDTEAPSFQFDFEADPGYQFRLEQGQEAIESSRAARGGLFSGGTGRALQEFGQGLASQEYDKAYRREYGQFGDEFNRERAVKGDEYNRLASLAGLGQTTSQQVASQQMAQGGNLANLQLQGGNIGAQRAMAGYQGGMNLLNTGLQAAGAIFSDKRLKENIKHIGTENGHNIYHFNYIDDDQKYKGVMAQEVLEKMPEAVTKVDGYWAVNYDDIGVVMEAL